jgi:hypothetical protein
MAFSTCDLDRDLSCFLTEKRLMPDTELWYVMLADGDVHRVTLDQLDDAFQAGHIDHETLVLAEGAKLWTKLGTLAGLDETPPPPQVPVTNSFRPVSVDLTDVDPSDLEDVPFRSRPSKKWFAAVAALAVVGTIAGVSTTKPWWVRPAMANVEALVSRATRAVHRNDMSTPSVAAQPPPPADPAAPLANPAPAGLPAGGTAASSPAQSGVSTASPSDRLSADLKQKLLDGDKQRDLKAKAHTRTAAPLSHPSAKNKLGGFTTGGNKYDPLNSAIQ